MNTKRTEVLAAWIVAFALIGAMAVNALLPRTPSRLEPGVTAVGQHRVAPQAAAAGETD
jgi:hypothetical protein